MASVDLRTAAGGISDHNSLQNLTVGDPHTQYVLLAGRAGGQTVNGGTAASENLTLRGTTNANLGLISVQSPIRISTALAGAVAFESHALTYNATEAYTAAFIGGGVDMSPTITFTNAVFIWEGNRVAPNIQSLVAPSFAAFTLLQALPVLRAGSTSTFNPLNPLILNAGAVAQNEFSGTRTVASHIGINWVPQLRATVSGAVMNATNVTGIQCTPAFSTVAGSSISFGTIRGVLMNNPGPALFQPGAGTETMTAYIGLDMVNVTFGGNVTKAAVRSAQAAASNAYFLLHTGTAQSSLSGQLRFPLDLTGITFGLSSDINIGWGAPGFFFFNYVAGDQVRFASDGSSTHTWSASTFGVSANQLLMGFAQFAFGQTSAVGNQVGIFAAASRSTSVAGEWTDYLLTQAGNLTIDHAMTALYAWTLNPISITSGSGSLTGEVATLNVGGMTTSGLGSNPTSALRVAGRGLFRGSINLHPITAANLTVDVDDYTGMGTGSAQRSVLRVSTDGGGARIITGFDVSATTVRENDTIWITNVGTDNISLAHQNVGSTAANRIISPTGANLVLGADESALLWYDDTDTRWRILYHTGT